MEYITGKTLADEAGSFTPSELLNLARDMAKALVELHKNKIVHRDIKPSNIMRAANGSYLLMDLGIAKAENPDGNDFTLTVNQAIFGTPVYASAEQCQSPHTADHRSDIYSLGATLYHLASGKAPYNGKTPLETLVQVIQSDPQPLAKAAPHLPAPLVELIECMMNKSPELRPQDAGILLTMLNSIEEQLRHPIRRSWRLWKIAAAAVLVTAAVGIWAGKIYFHQQKKPCILTFLKYHKRYFYHSLYRPLLQ
jgi:serine/threonine protein kinase